MIFESERLEYRLFNENDTDAMMQFWGDPEVMAFCGGAENITAERLIKTANFYQDLYKKSSFTVFAVILKESGALIGAAGFNPTENDTEVELIYHFAKAYWGHGYATESAQACMNFIKTVPAVKLVSSSFSPGHHSSKAILEKIGFVCKGLKWFEDSQQEEPLYEFELG